VWIASGSCCETVIVMASGREKAKFKLIDTLLLLPQVWFIKLRAMRRRRTPQKQERALMILKAPDNHKPPVVTAASFAAFLLPNSAADDDAEESSTSDGKLGSPSPPPISPLNLSDNVEIRSVEVQQFCSSSPHNNRESLDGPSPHGMPESQAPRGSFMLPLVKKSSSGGTSAPVKNPQQQRGRNSLHSPRVSESSGRCVYMENSPASFRKVAPTVRAWLLVGCGTVSRSSRSSCQGGSSSLDLDTDSVIEEVDDMGESRLECCSSTDEKSIDPAATGPKWRSREHSASWSMELASDQGEVVLDCCCSQAQEEGLDISSSSISDNPQQYFFLGRKLLAADAEERLHGPGSGSSWREDNPQEEAHEELTVMRSNDETATLLMDSLCNPFQQRNLEALLLATSEGGESAEETDSPVFECFREDRTTTAIDPHAAARNDAAGRRAKRSTQREKKNHQHDDGDHWRPGGASSSSTRRRKFPSNNKRNNNSRRESTRNRADRDIKRPVQQQWANETLQRDDQEAEEVLQHHGVVKESVAVVKSSYDPYSDFRESMVEMIVEKEIQQTADLEELLQCYLSLNEVEYHTVIVDVFTDVWQDLFGNCQ